LPARAQRNRVSEIQENAASVAIAGPGNATGKPALRAGTGEVLPGERKRTIQGADAQIMRPKKIILCVDDNEQELSVQSFMLATNGYRVVSATTGQEAIGLFSEMQVDLVLADFGMPQMNGGQLVDRLKEIAGHVPMILMGDPQKMAGEMHAADALLAKKNCSAQELLERIKIMSARKRGPRKGAQRQAPMMVEQLAIAS